MGIHAAALVVEVARLLNDHETGYQHIRWPRADLLEYLYDAEMAAYAAKPEAYAHDETVTLRPGTRQGPLPEGCKLQKIIGSDGSDRRARKVDDVLMQAFSGFGCKPACDDDGIYAVSGFSFNPQDPAGFFVEPPVPDDGQEHSLDIVCLQEPKPLTEADLDRTGTEPDADVIGSPTRMHNALIEFMLYRAYSVDMESGQSHAKAVAHLQTFNQMLGIAKTENTRAALSQSGSQPQGARP